MVSSPGTCMLACCRGDYVIVSPGDCDLARGHGKCVRAHRYLHVACSRGISVIASSKLYVVLNRGAYLSSNTWSFEVVVTL